MAYYASITLKGDESFPPVVIYLRFLQQILRTSCSSKVPLWNSQMEYTIHAKFGQKENSINITWTCRLKVFSSRNNYYVCSTIWTYKFLRISHCDFVTLTGWPLFFEKQFPGHIQDIWDIFPGHFLLDQVRCLCLKIVWHQFASYRSDH